MWQPPCHESEARPFDTAFQIVDNVRDQHDSMRRIGFDADIRASVYLATRQNGTETG
jgi:hypothetical protein